MSPLSGRGTLWARKAKKKGHGFRHVLFLLAYTLPQVLAEKFYLLNRTVSGDRLQWLAIGVSMPVAPVKPLPELRLSWTGSPRRQWRSSCLVPVLFMVMALRADCVIANGRRAFGGAWS